MRQYTATMSGWRMKEVTCEACDTEYVYRVVRTRGGSGNSVLWLDNEGAEERARRRAEEPLDTALRVAVGIVPCPVCGWVQHDMVKVTKRRRFWIAQLICLPIAITLMMIACAHSRDPLAANDPLFGISLAMCVFGFAGGLCWYYMHNPNSRHPGPGMHDTGRAEGSSGITRKTFLAAGAANSQELEEKIRQA